MDTLVVVGNTDPELRLTDIHLTLPYRASVCVTVSQYHKSGELREAIARRQVLVLQGLAQPPQMVAMAAEPTRVPTLSSEQLVAAPPSPPMLEEIHTMLKQLLEQQASVSMGVRVVEVPQSFQPQFQPAASQALPQALPDFSTAVPTFVADISPVVVEEAVTVKSETGAGVAKSANALRSLRKKSL